jgi:hypothetical protein
MTVQYAREGAIRQDGPLPITACKSCGCPIVWATSRKNGKRYPVSVAGWEDVYYVKSNLHSREVCTRNQEVSARNAEIAKNW